MRSRSGDFGPAGGACKKGVTRRSLVTRGRLRTLVPRLRLGTHLLRGSASRSPLAVESFRGRRSLQEGGHQAEPGNQSAHPRSLAPPRDAGPGNKSRREMARLIVGSRRPDLTSWRSSEFGGILFRLTVCEGPPFRLAGCRGIPQGPDGRQPDSLGAWSDGAANRCRG